MKKKIILLIATVLIVLAVGCGATEETHGAISASSFKLEYITGSDAVSEYRDSETGVHYLIFSNKDGYGGMGGICPRYNTDGSLYVD